MPFKVWFNEAEQVIEIKVTKVFDWPVMLQLVPRVSELSLENQCRKIMVDARGAKLDLSVLKIYSTPEMLAKEFAAHGVDVRRLKRALMIVKDAEGYRFFETVSMNQSQNMRLFFDEPSAREWLRE